MEKRKWLSQQKLSIVLEGLSEQIEISKLCAKYQIAQAQYYKWRDQLLKFGHSAFETKDVTKKNSTLSMKSENSRILSETSRSNLKKTNFNYEKSKISKRYRT